MALDELFTYLGISWLADDINKYVLNSAKPTQIGKTPLIYDNLNRISRVGQLDLSYSSEKDIVKIGSLPSSLSWKNLVKPLGKLLVTAQGTVDYFNERVVTRVLGEREFDWKFANCGVAVFVSDCNVLRFVGEFKQPLQIGKNTIQYDQNRFVTDVAGLKIQYDESDSLRRVSSPDVVGGIRIAKEEHLVVSLGVVKPEDLKD